MSIVSTYRRQKGFNLIELLVVVGIIGILTMIAYPSYQDYLRKTRRSDAKIALTEMANLQEKFFSNNNRYTSTITGVAALNYKTTSPNGYYNLSIPTATSTAFTATATVTGAQADDKDCVTMSITSTGAKSSNPGSKCW